MRLQRWQKAALVAAGTFAAFRLLRTTIKVGFTFAASFGFGFWLYLYLTDTDMGMVRADAERSIADRVQRRLGFDGGRYNRHQRVLARSG